MNIPPPGATRFDRDHQFSNRKVIDSTTNSEDSTSSEDNNHSEARSESESESDSEKDNSIDSDSGRESEGGGSDRSSAASEDEGGKKTETEKAEPKTSSHNYLKHITISRDQSEGSGFQSRNLLILKEGGAGAHQPGHDPFVELPKTTPKSKTSKTRREPRKREKFKEMDQFQSGPPPPPPPPGGTFSPGRDKSPPRRRKHQSKSSSRFTPTVYTSPGNPTSPIPYSYPSRNSIAIETLPQIPSAISQVFLDKARVPDPNTKTPLEIPNVSVASAESLHEYIVGLQLKAIALEDLERSREPSRYQVLYRIHPPQRKKSNEARNGPPPLPPSVFFDCPQWAQSPGGPDDQKAGKQLRSSLPLRDVSSYISKNPDVSFIVYRDYDGGADAEDGDESPLVTHYQELVSVCARDLATAVISLLESKSEYSSFLSTFRTRQLVPAPYLFFYHSRPTINDFVKSLSGPSQRQMSLLIDYITQQYGEEYETADSLLRRSRISLPYVQYMFKPGDILVAGSKNKIQAFVSKSWPSNSVVKEVYNRQGVIDSNVGSGKGKSKKHWRKVQSWPIDVWSWSFNGAFSKSHITINIQLELGDVEEKDIADFDLRPLSYLSESQSQHLRTQGEILWRCRFRRLISYSEEANRYFQNPADERYMIDLMTYQELHPHPSNTKDADEINDELMELDTPPSGNFIYLLPSTIKGYNLQRKKWLDLQVNRISEVTWNKEAFKSLVLDLKTKDLIEALISNQLAAERSTDLISGKGNGLILLLHGGPGTGKTLTAESVAEIAEKPLYRVTCGDIGTEPEQVEDYLESVLHLGKTWGCVVLLDEADVFLEQRGLEDLKRNALVSVFLRVLEYYDGILILTSNRVGTFDEAFKSRIQLALHYANLTPYQRGKIWENFISRLETLGEQNIDFNDLKDHVEQLAENEMNGRQIRNAITTARQYAQWKKTVLTYDHLKDIIEISGRFDKYLDRLNDGYSQDQLAQNEGLRFAGPP